MNSSQTLRKVAAEYKTVTGHSDKPPLILEHDGEAVAVLLSLQDFERYQALLHTDQFISATVARRAANRAIFGDLVGCPVSCDEPVWVPDPTPYWRVPYRLFDSTLLCVVTIDARTGEALFTNADRTALFEQIQQRMAHQHGAPTLA
ncbi:MAG: type II toxin-antitoxin system Phd/YefM family antitoxin [Caldilinea sp. CFX5]|nr:type II toxin-antitoxin system Phd/YefM family antitoxin [Caldilinea sp. CFX5]